MFVTVDGPGGVGKSTMIAAVEAELDREGVPTYVTTEPTRTPLGDLLRHGTYTYCGAALALLVAGDRHHHLTTEIQPALASGQVVISDRYVASSLVLQRIDGLDFAYVWQLNADLLQPDLAIILNGDPEVFSARLAERGTHSRFERQPGSAEIESRLCADTAARLTALGWPVCELDVTNQTPEQLAALVCSHIRTASATPSGAVDASSECV